MYLAYDIFYYKVLPPIYFCKHYIFPKREVLKTCCLMVSQYSILLTKHNFITNVFAMIALI